MSSCSDSSSVSAAQQQSLSQQINLAVTKKQLDATKAQGEAVLQLLDGAAQLSKAVGKGTQFDAVG